LSFLFIYLYCAVRGKSRTSTDKYLTLICEELHPETQRSNWKAKIKRTAFKKLHSKDLTWEG